MKFNFIDTFDVFNALNFFRGLRKNKKGDFNLFLFLSALVMLVLAMGYANYINNETQENVDFFDVFQDEIESIPESIRDVYLEDYFYYKELVNQIDVFASENFYDMIDNCESKYMGYCVIDDLDFGEYMKTINTEKEQFKFSNFLYIEDGQNVHIITK